MKKYKNKYRIESIRLKNWDYRKNGAYFITINTKNRQHFFGEIINNEMQLSTIGKLAEAFWEEIPVHFSHIELGNFVIMPNHTHGILIVKCLLCNDSDNKLNNNNIIESLHCNDSTIQNENKFFSDISPKSGSISTIIRSYKSIVTKNARLINSEFYWQPKFHDHIIRNSESFENIQKYIENNPLKWKEDKFY